MSERDLTPVFARLREVMAPFGAELDVVRDDPGDYMVNSRQVRQDGYVVMFGAVQVRSRYVSYHLLPVYAFPDLLDDVSLALRKRMQGKSCFTFTRVDEPLVEELAGLTSRAFDRMSQDDVSAT